MTNQDINYNLSLKDQWKLIKRVLHYSKPYLATIITGMVLIVAVVVLNVQIPMRLGKIFELDLLSDTFKMNDLLYIISVFLLTVVIWSILKYIEFVLLFSVASKTARDIRVDVFSKVQTLGMRYFDQTPIGSVVSRVTNDTESIEEMFVTIVASVLTSALSMIGVLIGMFIVMPSLALMSLVFVPLVLLVIYLYQKFSTKFYQQARESLSAINTKLAESISGMSIIQVFNQEQRVIDEFSEINEVYFKARRSGFVVEGFLLGSAIELLTTFAIGLVLFYFGLISIDNVVNTGLVFIFIEFVYQFFQPLFSFMDRIGLYQQAMVAAQRVFLLRDLVEVVPSQGNQDIEITEGKVEFKHLTFSYDGKHPVLKDISFTVNPGEMIALVGHTGSGKSSTINVLMRFYEYMDGDVLIDGHSIRDYSIEALRDKMGLVMQDSFLYVGTIKDNVTLFDENISTQQVKDACEFVQANTFIEQLDDQYEHEVIERGASFSSGQKQLISFARTIVKDPKILILDEATASIDTETEHLIQEGLEKIRQGRTTIAIAHRLSTIKDANLILVLDQGVIIESGTHDELIEKQGEYYQMYQTQKDQDS